MTLEETLPTDDTLSCFAIQTTKITFFGAALVGFFEGLPRFRFLGLSASPELTSFSTSFSTMTSPSEPLLDNFLQKSVKIGKIERKLAFDKKLLTLSSFGN